MDIDKLKAFVVVAEELNFRKSAEILGMSQPPLTRLISTLEDHLGVKLFKRTTRSVQLTGAGVVFLKESKDLIEHFHRIKEQVLAAAQSKNGEVRVAFSATAFLARFPVILDEFQKRFPKIKVDVQEAKAKSILQGLKEGKFDVGFVEAATEASGLQSHVVSEEEIGVLLPKRHPLAKRKRIAFYELENETIILHHKKEADEFFLRISKLIQGLKRKPQIYIKQDEESCPILVAMGRGVSLTIEGSRRVVPDNTCFVPIKGMFLPVSVFWKEASLELNTSVQTFVSAAIENASLEKSKTHCLSLVGPP